jgi:hypothetical protein
MCSERVLKNLLGVMAIAVALNPLTARAGPGGPIRVGVVDFYAPTPLATFSGFFPERFAADDLSDLLARAAGDRLVMIPRDIVQRSEQAMRWRETDVLHFDRLRALAEAIGADRLVVGWIPGLSIEGGGSNGPPPPGGDGNGFPAADATLVIQVFDARQGRLVAEARSSAYDLGGTRAELAKRVVDHALKLAIPALIDHLTAPAP